MEIPDVSKWTYETFLAWVEERSGAPIRAAIIDPDLRRFIPRILPHLTQQEAVEGLHWACAMAEWKSVKVMLANGVDPRGRTEYGTMVHAAIQSRCITAVRTALDAFPEAIHESDPRDISPFGLACVCGAPYEILRELLVRGSRAKVRYADLPMKGRPRADSEARFRILIAYGVRTDSIADVVMQNHYTRCVGAVEMCRSVAMAILSLGRLGRARGNGRDVLRLVAKEIWLSRCDDRWLCGYDKEMRRGIWK